MYSDDILKVIKTVAVEAVAANKPLTVSYGTVTELEPLSVKLSDRIYIDNDWLIFPADLDDIQEGDKLILLRAFEGMSYIVLGRIGESRKEKIESITEDEIDEICR